MPPIPIIPTKTPSTQRPSTQRPRLPSQRRKSDYDDVNKDLDDLIDNIKSKQSRELVNEKVNDIVNNIGNKKFNGTADIDFSSTLNDLKDTVDKVNKDNQTDKTDQVDYDELAELTKAKLAVDNIKPLIPLEKLPDLSKTRKPYVPINIPSVERDEELKNTSDILDKIIENYKKKRPGAGELFSISTKEWDIKKVCDNIKYLEIKLKNNDFTLSEYKKISDDIDQLKKSIPKKEKELYELKKGISKRTRTDQAKSFKDQNK